VLYPFGYGLTYSLAEIKNAVFSDGRVICEIANTGGRDTDEVVQLYIKSDSEYAPKNPRLCGFERVSLAAGESVKVEIELDKEAFTDVDLNGVRDVFGENFTLYCGVSQPDEKSVELCGVKPAVIQIKL
jgi:beta-glucosidase